MRFITAEEHDEMVKDAIAFVMEGIQCSMVMAKLPEKLLRIMNMWARTGWYDHNGEVKFEHCLWKVVAREMQKRVFAFLVERSREEMCMPDEDEFAFDHALTNVMRALEGLAWVDGYWPTLGAELADEAERWVTEYHEHFLIEGGDGGRFQYYDCVNEEVCYCMPHRLKPAGYEDQDYEDEETGEKEEEETETGWVCVGPGTLVPC
jgi:hypothetical protein